MGASSLFVCPAAADAKLDVNGEGIVGCVGCGGFLGRGGQGSSLDRELGSTCDGRGSLQERICEPMACA